MENILPLIRSKPYKAIAPEQTVARIRGVFVGLGIELTEEILSRENGRCSCCLRLFDPLCNRAVFQTIGKGRTMEYAMASAYGEMIERIQNLAFYMTLVYPSEPETKGLSQPFPFRYCPDEMDFSIDRLHQGLRYLFRNDVIPATISGGSYSKGIPFFNLFELKMEYLPVRPFQVVVGSNGMCSGNTPEEALIHGICEIFERYVLKQLFLFPCPLPDIPKTFFAGPRDPGRPHHTGKVVWIRGAHQGLLTGFGSSSSRSCDR